MPGRAGVCRGVPGRAGACLWSGQNQDSTPGLLGPGRAVCTAERGPSASPRSPASRALELGRRASVAPPGGRAAPARVSTANLGPLQAVTMDGTGEEQDTTGFRSLPSSSAFHFNRPCLLLMCPEDSHSLLLFMGGGIPQRWRSQVTRGRARPPPLPPSRPRPPPLSPRRRTLRAPEGTGKPRLELTGTSSQLRVYFQIFAQNP